jgi:hypothetical protein
MNDRFIVIDPRALAHCRLCLEPMYCIYDSALRIYCHECLQEALLGEKQGEIP